MRHAETVTFGGAGGDRAAELRANPDQIAALRRAPSSRVVLHWRGKPLVSDSHLTQLPPDHPLLEGDGLEVFLGTQPAGAAIFAKDISAWAPPEDQLPAPSFLDATEQRHPLAPEGATFRDLRGIMTTLSPADAEWAATARALFEWHRTHRFCANCGAASAPAHAGWQRDCPACGRHHFPRTDPVVIMLICSGNDVLLGRSPGWPERMYSLLAGFVEPGETLEAAARREVFEEAGVRVGDVHYLASQPWPFPASLMIGCSGQAITREIDIDPNEIEHALWVSRERMMSIMAGEDEEINPARSGAIAHFLVKRWLEDSLD